MKIKICFGLLLLLGILLTRADVMLCWTPGTTNDVALGINNYVVYYWPPIADKFYYRTNTALSAAGLLATNIVIPTPTNGTKFYVTSQITNTNGQVFESDQSNVVIWYDKPAAPTLFRFQTP